MNGPGSTVPTELAVLAPAGAAEGAATRPVAKAAEESFKLFGDDGLTFFDILDIINPLQHIPFVSTLYRRLTGDIIDAAPRVMGGALFGGPLGAVASLINVVVEANTGKDIGDHVFAFLTDEAPAGDVTVAEVPEAAFETAAGATPPVRVARTDLGEVSPPRNGGQTFPRPLKLEPLTPTLVLDGAAAGPSPELQAWRTAALEWEPAPLALAARRRNATTVLGEAARDADAFAAARYRSALRERDPEGRREAEEPPPGALAADGGWFTEAMLSALSKYEGGRKLAQPQRAHAVDLEE